jgi:hypothetical protein
MKCPTCGEETLPSDEGVTLVGYGKCPIDPANLHDDNCLKRYYYCVSDHAWVESLRRTCNTKGCDWKGRVACPCHSGLKVDQWSDTEFKHETNAKR